MPAASRPSRRRGFGSRATTHNTLLISSMIGGAQATSNLPLPSADAGIRSPWCGQSAGGPALLVGLGGDKCELVDPIVQAVSPAALEHSTEEMIGLDRPAALDVARERGVVGRIGLGEHRPI